MINPLYGNINNILLKYKYAFQNKKVRALTWFSISVNLLNA